MHNRLGVTRIQSDRIKPRASALVTSSPCSQGRESMWSLRPCSTWDAQGSVTVADCLSWNLVRKGRRRSARFVALLMMFSLHTVVALCSESTVHPRPTVCCASHQLACHHQSFPYSQCRLPCRLQAPAWEQTDAPTVAELPNLIGGVATVPNRFATKSRNRLSPKSRARKSAPALHWPPQQAPALTFHCRQEFNIASPPRSSAKTLAAE